MLAAERHSRWGIGAVAFLLAFLIHALFLFGLKINLPPIGDWNTGKTLVWVELPAEKNVKKEKLNILWNVNIKGHIAKFININKKNISKISASKNILEFNVKFKKKNICKYSPVRPVIFNLNFKNNIKTYKLIQSSGCVSFDEETAKFIDSISVKKISDNKNFNSVISITLSK